MGYQIASIILKDGSRYDQAIIESGFITRIKDLNQISFREEDIAQIVVTRDEWDFSCDRGGEYDGWEAGIETWRPVDRIQILLSLFKRRDWARRFYRKFFEPYRLW
jgi:hypothetical protein